MLGDFLFATDVFFFFFGTGADFYLSVIFHVERQLEASYACIKSVR